MLKRISLVAIFICSVAHAFSMTPPTVLQSWSDPLTVNAVSSSATLNVGGIQRIKLSEAPGSSANVSVSFFLEDGTTEVQNLNFTNSDSTADVDAQVNVLAKKAVVYVLPLVTQTYTAVVYGSHGGDTNATQTNASLLTTGTLPEAQLPSNVVTQDYTNETTFNANIAISSGIQDNLPLRVVGDDNTGLYAPAADALAVVLGGTNYLEMNTNAVSINNKLAVGINANPTAQVHIRVNSPPDSGIVKIESAKGSDPVAFISSSGYRGTIQAPTATQADDILSGFSGGGFGSANPSDGGEGAVFVKANEAWTDSAHGTYIYFETCPTGSTTQREVGRIAPGGMFAPYSSNTTPDAWTTGGMWFNTSTSALSIYDGANWITITKSN